MQVTLVNTVFTWSDIVLVSILPPPSVSPQLRYTPLPQHNFTQQLYACDGYLSLYNKWARRKVIFLYCISYLHLPGDACQWWGSTLSDPALWGGLCSSSILLTHTSCYSGPLSSARWLKQWKCTKLTALSNNITLTWTSWRSTTLLSLSSINEKVPYLAQCPGESDLFMIINCNYAKNTEKYRPWHL